MKIWNNNFTQPKFRFGGFFLGDFNSDLYGESLGLTFLRRLRDQKAFESADALAEQLSRDVQTVRELTM